MSFTLYDTVFQVTKGTQNAIFQMKILDLLVSIFVMQMILLVEDRMIPSTLSGADYGLGTIGTCLGPPPAGGPPSDQKKNP